MSAACVPLVIALTMSGTAQNATAQTPNIDRLVKDYQDTVKKYFAAVNDGLVPLYRIGTSYRVGDIWDPTMTKLLERNDQCFPNLSTRSTSGGERIGLSYQTELAVGLWLKLKSFVDFSASGKHSAIVKVNFEETVDEIASAGDLRRAFREDSCATSIPHSGSPVDLQSEQPVLIGRLFWAKRQITIAYGDNVALEGQLAEIGSLVTGLPVTVKAGAALGLERSIVIVDKTAVPLAYAPALVPVRTSGGTLGGPQNGADYVWTPFDPQGTPSHKAVLSELAETGESAWRWQDPAQ